MATATSLFFALLLLFLLIPAKGVTSQELEPYRTATFEISCYSDKVTVTRYFYIPNNDMDRPLSLKANTKRYIFGIGKELEPKIIGLEDNFGGHYPQQLVNLGDSYIMDFNFPMKDVSISPGNQYMIISKYVANSGVISNENGMKKFEFKVGNFNESIFKEVRVILPDCFWKDREFIDSYPKETKKEIVDGKLILTYDLPSIGKTIESLNNATVSMYVPGVRYNYNWAIKRGAIWIVSAVASTLIGIAIGMAIKLFSKK